MCILLHVSCCWLTGIKEEKQTEKVKDNKINKEIQAQIYVLYIDRETPK